MEKEEEDSTLPEIDLADLQSMEDFNYSMENIPSNFTDNSE